MAKSIESKQQKNLSARIEPALDAKLKVKLAQKGLTLQQLINGAAKDFVNEGKLPTIQTPQEVLADQFIQWVNDDKHSAETHRFIEYVVAAVKRHGKL